MKEVNSSESVNRMRARLERLSGLVLEAQSRLPPPLPIIGKGNVRRFQFGSPDIRHFLVLHAAKCISSLCAILDLYKLGYLFEAASLVRVYLDTRTQLDYVLAGVRLNGVDDLSKSYLKAYFADVEGDSGVRPKKIDITKKTVHERLSRAISTDITFLEPFGLSEGLKNDKDQVAKLHYDLYQLYSNYLHGRYVESMTLFEYETTELKCTGQIVSEFDSGYEETFNLFVGDIEKRYAIICLRLFPLFPKFMSNKTLDFAFETAGLPRPPFIKGSPS